MAWLKSVRAAQRRGLLIAVATLLVTGPATVAHAARVDVTTPTLTSFSVSAISATPGSAVTVNYTVIDDTAATLIDVGFVYTNSIGGSVRISAPWNNAPLTGSIKQVVPATWLNGAYTLTEVYVTDASGNTAVYQRAGTISKYPSGVTGPTGHTLKFAAGDFAVTGALPGDTTTPRLTSFSVSGTSASPGSTVSITYAVTDTAATLGLVWFRFTNRIGGSVYIRSSSPAPLTGSIKQVVPATWLNGAYTLTEIYMFDASINTSLYKRDGTIDKTPTGVTGPTSHTLQFATGDFSVKGASSGDATTPRLTSFSVSKNSATPNRTIKIKYAVTDQAATLFNVMFSYYNSVGDKMQIAAGPSGSQPLNGTIEQVLPATWPNATYTLMSIFVTDQSENSSVYLRDGSIYKYPNGATGPTSHTFNLAAGDFTLGQVAPVPVVPGSPVIKAPQRGNVSAVVAWQAPATNGGSPITGYTVRVFAGTSTTVVKALTAGPTATTLTVPGLTNGTAYTFAVAAVNTVGTGAISTRSTSVTPATVPGAAAIATAVPGRTGAANTATVTWRPPSTTGGSAVTGYRVTALRMSPTGSVLGTVESKPQPDSARSLQIALPVPGNYRFTIVAFNAIGDAAPSVYATIVTA